MATMNISLPDTLKHFVRERSENSDFSNPSDYIRSLIRADKAQATLEGLLLEGLESGTPSQLSKSDHDYFENIISTSK